LRYSIHALEKPLFLDGFPLFITESFPNLFHKNVPAMLRQVEAWRAETAREIHGTI
jgi:hypothetical protein